MIAYYRYFILLFILGCNNPNVIESHRAKITNGFLKKIKKLNLDCLMGITIETRGELENGEMLIRASSFSYSTKDWSEAIVLPSYQIVNEDSTYKLDSFVSIRFVKELGLDTANHYNYTRNRIDCIRETFLKLHVFGIMSQSRLGDFIEFEIEKGCSVWYKEDKAWLNEVYTDRFKNGKEIIDNWYILGEASNLNVLDTIPDFIIRDGDTILLKYPPGFK